MIAICLLLGGPSIAVTLTPQQAEARAQEALAVVRGLGIDNVQLVGAKDRKVVDLARSGWRLTHSWEVGPTNPDFNFVWDSARLPQGEVMWQVRINVYLTTEDAEAALSDISLEVSHPLATFRKPYEQFSRAPIGRVGEGYHGRQPAVVLCGNVVFVLDRYLRMDGVTDAAAYWQQGRDATRDMALKLHDALHAKRICSGSEPEHRLEVEPHWAGPGTRLEVQLLSDRPLPQGRADFGPGIEQEKPAEQIRLPDASRPLGEVYGLKCHLKIAPDAAPGERDVTVTDKDGVRSSARFAVHPLVVVLDVDGLRADVLDSLLGSDADGKATNLMRLFGKSTGRKGIGGLEVTTYQNGVTVDQAITTFPSYTFPAQASLVTGVEPGTHGIVGNAFFDRETRTNYGLDGAEAAVHFVPQAMAVYHSGLASSLLQAPTVYEEIRRRNPAFGAVSIFHQFGSGLAEGNWICGDFVDQICYIPAFTTHWYDRSAEEEMMKQLKRCAPDGGQPLGAEGWPSLIWLYLPGVDHYSHKVDEEIYVKQVGQFVDKIDQLLEPVLDFFDRYPGTIFVLVSDHGHTDTRTTTDIGWDNWRQILAPTYEMWDKAQDISKCDVVARLNGGLAHVYVNAAAPSDADCGARWSEPPPFSKVLAAADRIARQELSGPGVGVTGGKVAPQWDLVLVRNAQKDGWDGPYGVLVPSQLGFEPKVEDVEEYLRRTSNAFGVRLGWQNSTADIEFIVDCFDGLGSVRSGDIVALPHYPGPVQAPETRPNDSYYHTTGGAYASQHGSFSMDDMHMSFAVAQPNCGDPSLLVEVLQRAIANPARPRVTDVPRVVTAFCGERFSPQSGPPAGGDPAPLATTPTAAAHTPPTASAPPAQLDLDTQGRPRDQAASDLAQLKAIAGSARVTAEAASQSARTCDDAQKLSDVGEFGKAEAVWLKAIQADPDSTRAWLGMGRNCLDDDRDGEATGYFRVAVRIEPDNPSPHLYLAIALMDKQKDEALREAEKAKALGHPDADAVIAMIRADE